jgi:hypothetical protein
VRGGGGVLINFRMEKNWMNNMDEKQKKKKEKKEKEKKKG